MPQIVKKRHSGWAVLTVAALIASLLAVGASSVSAIDERSEPDRLAKFTACVGEAAQSQGFSDVDMGSTFEGAIDCLAYYGISTGTGDGSTFEPDAVVSRWEMAVFLARAARLMSVDIGAEYDMSMMDDDMDMMEVSAAGFSDLGSVASWIAHEIDNVAAAGIMDGPRPGYFRPTDPMSRVDMAVALVELVDLASGVVNKDRAGLHVLGSAPGSTYYFADDPNPIYDYFEDVRRSYPADVDRAVSIAYELGITSGVGDGVSFDPTGAVTRGQMAAFITRALDHTLLRPAGLTAQQDQDARQIRISVRDADFRPVVNSIVDGFYTDNTSIDRAFRDDGTCRLTSSHAGLDVGVYALDGDSPCLIDRLDIVTDPRGEAILQMPDIGRNGARVWLWQGYMGEFFSAFSTPVFVLQLLPHTMKVEGNALVITSDLHPAAYFARYGSNVNVSIQLVGAGQEPTSVGWEDWYISVVRRWHSTYAALPSDTAATPQYVIRQDTMHLRLDSSGAASFDLAAFDPDPGYQRYSTTPVSFVISGVHRPVPNSNGKSLLGVSEANFDDECYPCVLIKGLGSSEQHLPDTVEDPSRLSGLVRFSDEPSMVSNIRVSGGYHPNPGTAGVARNISVVSVFDQYGSAMRSIPIRLTSTNNSSAITASSRYTGYDGTVRFTYSHSGSDMGHVERLTAKFGRGVCQDPVDNEYRLNRNSSANSDPDMEVRCGRAYVYWVSYATSEMGHGQLLESDVERNTIIVDTDPAKLGNSPAGLTGVVPVRLVYDSNDQFLIGGVPVSVDAFEQAIEQAAAIASPSKVDSTIRWSSYQYDNRFDVATLNLD